MGGLYCPPLSMINFYIKSRPRPQQRHRSSGRNFYYDPFSKDKKKFKLLSKEYSPRYPLIGFIEINFTFCYKRPQKHYRTKNKKKVLKDNMPYYKKSRPDIDNLCKFYMDAMQGTFYKDDAQITTLLATKVYGSEDYIHVKISSTKKYCK